MDGFCFTPSALYINDPIDCRRLFLSLSFYQLDQAQVMALSYQFMQWIYDLTGEEFVYDWSYDGKNTNKKKIWGQILEEFSPKRGLSIGFDAYVRSSQVYNLGSLRKYQRFVWYENPAFLHSDMYHTSASVDYLAYFNKLFPSGRPDNAELPHLIHKLFCEPDRKLLSYHSSADLTGSFSADSYQEYPNLYYGNASISFGAFCLGDAVNRMADMFAQFAQQLVESFGHVGIHIGLQPGREGKSPYMSYFRKLIADGSHEEAECSTKEWYPTYHLCGVEWLNILSPLARKHISDEELRKEYPKDILVREFDNGALMVKSALPITQYGPMDALAIKNIVRPALYPGWSSVPLRAIFPVNDYPRIYSWCPRNDWAIVPIEENEIRILGSELVFEANTTGGDLRESD